MTIGNQPGENQPVPAGKGQANRRKRQMKQRVEAWAIGTTSLGGLILIVYATARYAAW
jgi:hypothetical protein